MREKYLYALEDSSIGIKGGSKSSNLRYLIRKNYAVPKGCVLSWDALSDYLLLGESVLMEIREELRGYIQPDKVYAVRSSASIEDHSEFSCAGLFQSYLNVRGEEEIITSIMKVWQSLYEEKLRAYCVTNHIDTQSILMAVIIQEMVDARTSGVIFSKNPITGLSEIIIEAGEGNGDEQVRARTSPERWVSKWGNWIEKPEEHIITESFAKELAEHAHNLAKSYGKPVDLEWAHDGERLYFLQVRPITQLDIPIYSNRITKEMLPGIIKPLVWSVNTTMINKIWTQILVQLTGDTGINPETLTGYYYGRAYFNMALFGQVFESLGIPYEGLELLLGLEQDGPRKPHMKPGMKAVKRLPGFVKISRSFLTAEKRYRKMEPLKWKVYEDIREELSRSGSLDEDLMIARRISEETEDVAYFNIMLPMELMMHHRMLAGFLRKQGYDIRNLLLEGVEDAANKYSPHYHLTELKKKYQLPKASLTIEEKENLEKDISVFLERFGHFSDSGNDCSKIPWRETPELILKMVEMAAEPLKEDERMRFDELKLPMGKRGLYGVFYRRTSRYAVLRESISSLYTFGYGQFRNVFVKIGSALAKEGLLEDQEDVYYLYWKELVELIEEKKTLPLKELVRQRKEELAGYEKRSVPEIIVGKEQPPCQEDTCEDYRGIPTSLGVYSGPARVLNGFSDFERLLEGDVLIIPYSDVGWSPLFARAGAVIAESGGILSHSSIVAREYRIPAVVSVPGACRIPDGMRVTVDGYSGNIFVEKQ
ncbi:hypothetical protein J3A84_06285 [Proteiniclasticum sp. SCR006]|uniref:Phosphoenolpyruvate synthase n=1 Tax=Proteiniclasticum aestuarii TaxID=2817862 RepID=A0A939H9X6_9CLOT|nr:PEP/pyruvate-binding domain-containing protein [Proteiniclasticum aestuarii]MBO1264633.1 hypothetical protein [Proteiniclasticum aestuarii]